jgi:hypothetical protein
MAPSLSGFRAALDNKIWNTDISREVTVYNLSSSSVDERGTVYPVYDSGTAYKAVPYNTMQFVYEQVGWGVPSEEETDMVFRYDVSIAKDSLVVDSSGTGSSMLVRDIESYPYGNGSVATVVRLVKQL